MQKENLFDSPAGANDKEVFDNMLQHGNFRLERIVSTGQQTPAGQWYDQDTHEWVVLLKGAAKLRFEDNDECLEMQPGDYVHIPAGCRHRVEWTDPDRPTIWLALHYNGANRPMNKSE